MNKMLILTALAVIAGGAPAHAACIGSGAISSCWDDNGNSYTVNRFGNTTIMNGHNSGTGSSWSQTSTTFGNTTFHNGAAADGGSWSVTQQRIGNNTFYSGHDSDGNSVSKTCGLFGCN